MVDPLLHSALHAHFLEPVNVVGGGAGIRRTGHKLVKFLLSVIAARLYAVDFHPFEEFGMIYDIFLERIARLVDIIHTHIHI